jgi:hypothetical protein
MNFLAGIYVTVLGTNHATILGTNHVTALGTTGRDSALISNI